MNKKVSNLIDLEYYGNVNLCNELLKRWRDAKPDNEDLKLFAKNYLDIIFYVNRLDMERYGYEKSFSEFRADKLRAIERARKMEIENDKLKKEINKLKNLTNL
mgnify:FL=1